MTQAQLAQLASIPLATIVSIEKGDTSALNMKMQTLNRIAHALGCKIFVNIKWKPYPGTDECQPLGPELPPLPKRQKGNRGSVMLGRKLAKKHGNLWKDYHKRREEKLATKILK